jgi:hypothetical protein
MSIGQLKSAFVFSRRQREQLEGMANSSCLSVGQATRAHNFLSNADEKHIQLIACQARLCGIDGHRL